MRRPVLDNAHLRRDVHLLHQISQQNDTVLQEPDDRKRFAFVIVGDLMCQLANSPLQLRFRNECSQAANSRSNVAVRSQMLRCELILQCFADRL